MFFSFDGLDGVGKTTQIALFCDWLRDRGCEVTQCRDPGGTPLGEQLREIVLHADAETPIHRRAEMLIYMASRAQLVEQVIRPALAEGQMVVSDRFLMANLAYQGHAGGLDLKSVRQVGELAVAGVMPDCVFLLDMDPDRADRRIDRDRDRMERQGDAYRRRLREGFLIEAQRDARRIHIINASSPIEQVHQQIIAATLSHLSASTT